MNSKLVPVFAVTLLILAGVALYTYRDTFFSSGVSEVDNGGGLKTARYESENGIFFIYRTQPDGYEVGEYDIDGRHIIIVMDSDDARDLKGAIGRGEEGPPAMLIEQFSNVRQASLEQWLNEDSRTNFNIKQGDISTRRINGMDGLEYNWDGLYRGRSIALVRDGTGYIFSVTYNEVNDEIVNDFDQLLAALSINR